MHEKVLLQVIGSFCNKKGLSCLQEATVSNAEAVGSTVMLFFCLRVDAQETKGTGSFRKFRNALLADYYSKQDTLPVDQPILCSATCKFLQQAQVSAHVFVGSFGATQNKHRLLELGITRILCLSPILPHPYVRSVLLSSYSHVGAGFPRNSLIRASG